MRTQCKRKWLTSLGLFAFLGVSLSVVDVAVADVRALGTRERSVALASWGAVAALSGGGFTYAPLQMAWTINQGVAYQYFEVANTGSTDLSGQTYHATVVHNNFGNPTPPTVTFEACVSGSWTAANSCTGTLVSLGSTSTEMLSTIAIPLPVNQRLQARAVTSPSGHANFTTSISVLAERNQIRPAVVSNL